MGLWQRIFGSGKKKVPYPPDLEPQIEKAMHALEALTAAHDGTWHIGQADWNVDQDQGTIVFTSPKGIRAVAPVQIIGTITRRTGRGCGGGIIHRSCRRWRSMRRRCWRLGSSAASTS